MGSAENACFLVVFELPIPFWKKGDRLKRLLSRGFSVADPLWQKGDRQLKNHEKASVLADPLLSQRGSATLKPRER